MLEEAKLAFISKMQTVTDSIVNDFVGQLKLGLNQNVDALINKIWNPLIGDIETATRKEILASMKERISDKVDAAVAELKQAAQTGGQNDGSQETTIDGSSA